MSEPNAASQRYRQINERLQQLRDELSQVRGQETRLLVERKRLERERHEIEAAGWPKECQENHDEREQSTDTGAGSVALRDV